MNQNNNSLPNNNVGAGGIRRTTVRMFNRANNNARLSPISIPQRVNNNLGSLMNHMETRSEYNRDLEPYIAQVRARPGGANLTNDEVYREASILLSDARLAEPDPNAAPESPIYAPQSPIVPPESPIIAPESPIYAPQSPMPPNEPPASPSGVGAPPPTLGGRKHKKRTQKKRKHTKKTHKKRTYRRKH